MALQQNDEAQTIFLVQISPEVVLEVRISRASTPVIGTPPKPKKFEFACELSANSQFMIRGELDEATATPVIGQPPKPK